MNSYNSVLADIGNRICQRREMLGMSGTELALRADISASTLSKIENGRRNIGVETLCAVAKALEVPLSFLQPKELDMFTEDHQELPELENKLNQLSADQKSLMLSMFSAQIDVILGVEEKY